jgi:tetratricopeptide (TPR) repeat protein
MKCKEIAEQGSLEKYLDGLLERTDRDALEFHIRLCIQCMVKLENLRNERAGVVPAPAVKEWWKELFAKRWLVIAACAVIAVAAAFVVEARRRSAVRRVPITVTIPSGHVETSREERLQELSNIGPLTYRASTRVLATSAGIRHREAIQLYNASKFGQAANAFRDVLEVDPRDSHSWLFMGVSYARIGEVVKAEEALRNIVQKPSDEYMNEARIVLARVLFAQRRLQEGIAVLSPLEAPGNPYAALARRLIAIAEKLE